METEKSPVLLLRARELEGGGFPSKLDGSYCPEATCWTILALLDDPVHQSLIERARARLAADQLVDGRVCISNMCPEVTWPTSLAVLAWHKSKYQKNQDEAIHFLLRARGIPVSRDQGDSLAHDSTLVGWPWVLGTHSWVEPTGLAMLALKVTGHEEHARFHEGVRLLLDRQLPHGGWNYGNTCTFGQELRPTFLNTGVALNALKDEVFPDTIKHSLTYLEHKIESQHTPWSLGWGLLGLKAWGRWPDRAQSLIYNCLLGGTYDTAPLALLLVALRSSGGLEDIF